MVTVVAENPFESESAVKNSGYSQFVDGVLLLADSGEPAPPLADRVHSALRALILDPEFPCVGSRSALNQGSHRFAMYQELNSADSTAGLARDLYTFVQEQPKIEGDFSTFIACFDTPKLLSPEEFEAQLWEQLRALHELDKDAWDQSVSSDPKEPKFAFSFAGRAFFVVGLSPMAERWARRFPWPTIAFNAHFQFDKMRQDGSFEMMRDTIRDRDTKLEGQANPNVEDFGEHTEARQYSGRNVSPDWKCPVQFDPSK